MLARAHGLPTAEKRDSQGLCFIGKIDIKEFLSHYIEPKKGDVLNENGEVVGNHDGSIFLTLGERHGFTITKKTADDAPYYVVARDIKKNTVTVSHRFHQKSLDLDIKKYILESVNWIAGTPYPEKEYGARIRHLGELLPCTVQTKKGATEIVFKRGPTVASGQSIVLYDRDECLGGGIVL
jgi:tRNA-specific 2-thiouridylase